MYLKSIPMVINRCKMMLSKAKLEHFLRFLVKICRLRIEIVC